MNWTRVIRKTFLAWNAHWERKRFFKAFPEAEADYIARKQCRAKHRRGVKKAENRAFVRTFTAMRGGNGPA